ncbi:MAG: molybdopterin-dependent oxidoreductase [Chloroflexi bacterium]|nr:molybdopterin-dependent oxidoreductase [Chloroflexota bacterium]
MTVPLALRINGRTRELLLPPDTPLLYALRNELNLKAAKYGCGSEQCGACAVLVDGVAVPSCQLPLYHCQGLDIITLEGLAEAGELHPLQETFLEEQAAQCGFCSAGMIVAAQGLLNRVRYPTDADIRSALAGNLCRCGVYDRVRRAIKLRTGRIEPSIVEVMNCPPLENSIEAASPSLSAHPQLDDWLHIEPDGRITLFSGKVELGQGIATALAQIAADELDVALWRIDVVCADTERSPDEGGTTGSRSLESSGVAIRCAAAEARQHLLSLAYEALDSLTPAEQLQVRDGVISDPSSGRSISYWDLQGGRLFNRRVSGSAPQKEPSAHSLVGTSARRIDLRSKFSGGASYVHDRTLPDMQHATVLRPPGYHARLVDFDIAAARALPGVAAVVQNGQFIAIVCEREEVAIAAVEQARDFARWTYAADLPDAAAIFDDLGSKPRQSHRIEAGAVSDSAIPPIKTPPDAAITLRATYSRPFQMHGSLGPSAALALWDEGQLTVWSPTQAAFILRGALAQVLSLDEAQIRVIHSEGAGCYGHNGADDAALDAALVAMALPATPILLKWSRWDEQAWEPYGTAMRLDMQASLDADGTICDWNHDVYSYAHSTRPAIGLASSGLLAARYLERAFTPQPGRAMGGYHSGAHRNADPLYDLPRRRIVVHAVRDSPLRVSALRSLGAYANIFAIESMMDELANAAGSDPLDFRLRHLRDERARAVLLAAADKVGWQRRDKGVGWGMALAQYKNLQCYCAIIVRLRVNPAGEIDFRRVVIAADAGQVVNPDGLSNQLEGGFVQAASWTLYEAVQFDKRGITSTDWDSYPILRFPAAPKIEVLLLNRPDQPFLGAGEAAQNPTPAAIANAIFDATKLRLRDIPFTPQKLRA